VVRLIPGVLKKNQATTHESFQKLKVGGKTKRLLEYPQYTRPANFRGHRVPKILLSGDHKRINDWQLKQALLKTKKRRSDLLLKNS
jgi:tRNA (guanine37-N1)-methyltransferase